MSNILKECGPLRPTRGDMMYGKEFIVEEPGSLAPNLKKGFAYKVWQASPTSFIPNAHHITSIYCINEKKVYATDFFIQDDGYVLTTLGPKQPCFSLDCRYTRIHKYKKGEQMDLFDQLEEENG